MNRIHYPQLDETVYSRVLENGLTVKIVPRRGFTRKMAYFVTNFGAIHTDFELEGETVSCDEICSRLNDALVEGVRVLRVYEDGYKLKHLAYLDAQLELEYDGGADEKAADSIRALFAREQLTVEKKGKNGITQQDIIPMIRSLDLTKKDDNTLRLSTRICCQNPSLNPMQLAAAIERYLPEFAPDFTRCCRVELYDTEEKIFR